MTYKPCTHEVSINLEFLKRILSCKFVRFANVKTHVTFVNFMSEEDKKKLANWLITSSIVKPNVNVNVNVNVDKDKDKS